MWTNRQGIASHGEGLCVSSLGVCRLCMLEGCSSMDSIFRSTIPSCVANKIARVTRLSLTEGDGLPAMVCQQCLFQLDVADTFIRRCAQSDRSFRFMLSQGERESVATGNGNLIPLNLSSAAELVGPLAASQDTVAPVLDSRIEQDPDEQISQITEHPIKLEVADSTLYYEEQDTEDCTDGNELHGDDYFENDTGDNISIKMEELDTVDSSYDGPKEYSVDVLTGSENCTNAQSEVIQTPPLVEEKHKCSMCSSEFATKKGLASHFRHHLIKKRKEKLAALLLQRKIRKQTKDTNNEIDNMHSNLEGECVSAFLMPINISSQGREIALPLQNELNLSQPLAKRFKCALCQADFPSRLSLSSHCRRAKFHKKKRKGPYHSTATRSQQLSENPVSDQQEQNVSASSHCQVVSINKNVTKPVSEMVDLAVDTPTIDFILGEQGHESLEQPKRSKLLSVNNKFKCSICSVKFSTKLKQALHICQGKDHREKILRRRLRIRAPKAKADRSSISLELPVQGANQSPGDELDGISENTSDIPQKESEIMSAPLSTSVDNEGFAGAHQEHDSEKSSNAVTRKREEAEPEVQAKSHILNRFKCKVCSMGFSFTFQLTRHMQTAKHHKNSKLNQRLPMRTGHTKSAKAPQPLTLNDVGVARKLDDMGANANLMLKESTNGELKSRFTLQPPLSKDQISCMPINASTNKEPETHVGVGRSVANSKDFKCVSCLFKFSSSLRLARHICHAKNHYSEKDLDDRLPRVIKRRKQGKQSQSTVNGEDMMSGNVRKEAIELMETTMLTKQQQVVTAWEHVGNEPQLPAETLKSSDTASKLLFAPDCTQASHPRIASKNVMCQEPIKRHSRSEVVGKELSETHFDGSLENNSQVPAEKVSKRQIDSTVVLDKGRGVKPLSNPIENVLQLPAEEIFPGSQELSVLQHSHGGLQNILSRKLIVQLNRLAFSSGEEEEVIDCKLSGIRNTNKNPKPNIQKSSKSADLNNIEKFFWGTQKQPSASKKDIVIKKETGFHAEGCKLRPKTFKCKFCFLECVSPSSLRGHIKQHNGEIARKQSLRKACEDDVPCTQSRRSSRNPGTHTTSPQSNAASNNESMQHCKTNLLCTVCSVQFSTELSLASHAKLHDKYQHQATPSTIPNSASKTVDDSSINCKTLRTHCDGCLKTFASWDTLKKHKLRHSCGTMPYQCQICYKGFQKRYNRNAHIQTAHLGQLPVQADRSEKMEKHSHTPSKQLPVSRGYPKTLKVPCDGCSKSFASFNSLRIHKLNRFCGSKPYNCKLCSLTFNTVFERRAHVKTLHIGHEAEPDIVDAKVYPKNCEFCDQVLMDDDSCIQHINRHSKEVQCHVCDKICSTPYQLKIHLVTHKALRPYQCSDCPLTFKLKHHLVNHKYRWHCPSKQGKLKVAQATFKTRLLKVKAQGKVSFKPQKAKMQDSFSCSFCNWTCKKEEDLQNHILTHDSERNKCFSCQICSRDFKTQSNFTRHMSKHAPKFKS